MNARYGLLIAVLISLGCSHQMKTPTVTPHAKSKGPKMIALKLVMGKEPNNIFVGQVAGQYKCYNYRFEMPAGELAKLAVAEQVLKTWKRTKKGQVTTWTDKPRTKTEIRVFPDEDEANALDPNNSLIQILEYDH